MKLTKAQKEIYYRITSDLKDYDKETSLDNIIDELKHQIETELWHKEEYNDSYSDLNVRVAKNLLKLLIAKKNVDKLLNNGRYSPAIVPEYKGRGGKRQGAGRPKGTTKPETKKMYSFRLSEEEEKAVRELLKKMRNR
jgi:hypothetical protein